MQSDVTEVIADIAAGKMVIIVDDENRENEGDLVIAADKITPEAINFMSKYGRGLICLTLTREHCQRLNLALMVDSTDDFLLTNFTVSIDARAGISTGISAHDRAHTIQVAVAAESSPADIVCPGHIFPLMAQAGGVLTRAGHTEAGCDLARLAGCSPAAVIVEILNDDGSMARRNDIDKFAAQHGLKIALVEDLIRYRIENEKTVHFVRDTMVKTDYGEFRLAIYKDIINKSFHVALTQGELKPDKPVLVRVHIENTLNDVIGIRDRYQGWSFSESMRKIAAAAEGVVVVLRLPEHHALLEQQLLEMGKQNEEMNPVPERWTLGIGGQILQDLGVGRMRLISSPQRFHGLGGFGLSIEEYIIRLKKSE